MPPESLRGARTTFRDLAQWYVAQESVKALASYDIIKMKLSTFNKEFGDWPVNRINIADLKNFQTKLLKSGLDPATVDQTLKKVKTMVNLALGAGKISSDVYVAFKSLRKTQKKGTGERDRILSPQEFSRLIGHAEGHLLGILVMGFFTGMRKGEIVGLTWDRVDLTKRLIYLRAVDTKGKVPRSIPIHDDLLMLLESMPNRPKANGEWRHVFTFRGKAIKGNIYTGLRQACEKAGIVYGRYKRDGFVLHDLRRTFVTYLGNAGQRQKVVMAIAGQTAPMNLRYDRPTPKSKHNAVNQLPSFRESITKSINIRKEEGPSEEEPSSLTN